MSLKVGQKVTSEVYTIYVCIDTLDVLPYCHRLVLLSPKVV